MPVGNSILPFTSAQLKALSRMEESDWPSRHHPRLSPLWPGFEPGFEPGLVRGLRSVDLNLTPGFFLPVLRVLRFSSLRKNPLSQTNLCRQAYSSRLGLERLGNHSLCSDVYIYIYTYIHINFITNRKLEKVGHYRGDVSYQGENKHLIQFEMFILEKILKAEVKSWRIIRNGRKPNMLVLLLRIKFRFHSGMKK